MQKTETPPIAACCAEPGNREEVERKKSEGSPGELITERCTVCARRHYTLEADPATLGVTGPGV